MGKNSAAILLSTLMLVGVSSVFADTYVRQPFFDVLHYDISIEVTDSSDSITGTTKIQVQVRSDAATGMWLDFEDMVVDELRVGKMVRPFTLQEGRLAFSFDRTYLGNETVLIEVRYHGNAQTGLLFGKNRYGRRFIFADNWPNNAHHWFPSIDHPSDKASVTFEISAPGDYAVVANGSMEETVLLPDGRRLTLWNENKAIPTYCMVFGIGKFLISHSVKGSVPLAWYVYPEDSKVAARKFSRTPFILAYFESLIGPYPYEKLAQVESTIRLGAMENSSAIFYSESLFARKPVPEEPVAHEIAHQWFGNSITESDWDHLWLSEGFATYFEALFYEHMQGREALKQIMDRYKKKISRYRPALYESIVDSRVTDPAKKLTPLNYEKGAWVLHMLRGILGDETFFKGIRRFYDRYAGGNALTEDFQKAMEDVSGKDLSRFFRQWLYQPGLPEYKMSWNWGKSGELEISISQLQTATVFDMPMEIAVSAGGRTEIHRFHIREAIQAFQIPLRTRPSAVILDPNNWVLKTDTVTQIPVR